MPPRSCLAVLATVLALISGACGGDDPGPGASTDLAAVAGAGDQAGLTGSGSTFAALQLRRWIERYRSLVPGVSIDYEAIGSPAAVERLKDDAGDFFASELPLSELEEALLGGSESVVQVPWMAGAIAVAYNLPDVGEVRLSPDNVAGIFAGRIVRWDDPALRADNQDTRLPSLPVQVVYRSDDSGTTAVFSAYLEAAASGSWGLGSGTTVPFPRGRAVNGSESVAAAVRDTPGAVGYVQLSYARQAELGVALLGNRSGRFLLPTSEAVNAALAGADVRRFGTTAKLFFTPDAPGAYPLCALSYLMYRRSGGDPDKRLALRHFAVWALTEGQRLAEPLGYAELPLQFRVLALDGIERPR